MADAAADAGTIRWRPQPRPPSTSLILLAKDSAQNPCPIRQENRHAQITWDRHRDRRRRRSHRDSLFRHRRSRIGCIGSSNLPRRNQGKRSRWARSRRLQGNVYSPLSNADRNTYRGLRTNAVHIQHELLPGRWLSQIALKQIRTNIRFYFLFSLSYRVPTTI